MLSQAEHKQEAPAPAPAKQDVQVGSSIGLSQRNPLDLIKHDVPLLSEAKSNKQPRTLGPLLDAAGRDETCVWYRVSQDRHYLHLITPLSACQSALPVYLLCMMTMHMLLCIRQCSEIVHWLQSFNLGNKTELLVTVRQPEGTQGSTNITLTTDQPSEMVMHWGVKKQGKGEWVAPPENVIPKGSQQASEIAYDTPLQPADSIEVQGDKLQLQQAVLEIPAGHDLTGLTFVCKSKDETMWWRDGGCST